MTKWTDKRTGCDRARGVSSERDTGFEPATSSLGSWLVQVRQACFYVRKRLVALRVGRRRAYFGPEVVRDRVRLVGFPSVTSGGWS